MRPEVDNVLLVERFIGRWFDCEPTRKLDENLQALVLPFVVTAVFGGERLAREWLAEQYWREARRKGLSAR